MIPCPADVVGSRTRPNGAAHCWNVGTEIAVLGVTFREYAGFAVGALVRCMALKKDGSGAVG
jgi:hypothetical protein